MEQFPQIACLFHPGQLLSNFCADSACLLPLCGQCLKLHHQQHKNLKTPPQIQQLNISISQTKSKLMALGQPFFYQNFQAQFQSLKQRLKRFVDEIFSSIEQQLKLRKVINQNANSLIESLYNKRSMRTLITLKPVNFDKGFVAFNQPLLQHRLKEILQMFSIPNESFQLSDILKGALNSRRQQIDKENIQKAKSKRFGIEVCSKVSRPNSSHLGLGAMLQQRMSRGDLLKEATQLHTNENE